MIYVMSGEKTMVRSVRRGREWSLDLRFVPPDFPDEGHEDRAGAVPEAGGDGPRAEMAATRCHRPRILGEAARRKFGVRVMVGRLVTG